MTSGCRYGRFLIWLYFHTPKGRLRRKILGAKRRHDFKCSHCYEKTMLALMGLLEMAEEIE